MHEGVFANASRDDLEPLVLRLQAECLDARGIRKWLYPWEDEELEGLRQQALARMLSGCRAPESDCSSKAVDALIAAAEMDCHMVEAQLLRQARDGNVQALKLLLQAHAALLEELTVWAASWIPAEHGGTRSETQMEIVRQASAALVRDDFGKLDSGGSLWIELDAALRYRMTPFIVDRLEQAGIIDAVEQRLGRQVGERETEVEDLAGQFRERLIRYVQKETVTKTPDAAVYNCAWLVVRAYLTSRTRRRKWLRDHTGYPDVGSLDAPDPDGSRDATETIPSGSSPWGGEFEVEPGMGWLRLSPELSQALLSLPDGMRSAVILIDVLDFTCAKAAAVLGISEGAVRTAACRGRDALRAKLRSRPTASKEEDTDEHRAQKTRRDNRYK